MERYLKPFPEDENKKRETIKSLRGLRDKVRALCVCVCVYVSSDVMIMIMMMMFVCVCVVTG